MPNASLMHLRDRREAVRRARGVRHDAVLGRVVALVVDADHEGRVIAAGGRADDHALRAALKVQFGLLARGEQARRFDHDSCADAAPRNLRRIALAEHRDLLPVHHDRVAVGADLSLEAAVDRVVLEQVREGLRIDQIVDADDFDASGLHGAKRVAPDSSEPVDAYFDCHGSLLLLVEGLPRECLNGPPRKRENGSPRGLARLLATALPPAQQRGRRQGARTLPTEFEGVMV